MSDVAGVAAAHLVMFVSFFCMCEALGLFITYAVTLLPVRRRVNAELSHAPPVWWMLSYHAVVAAVLSAVSIGSIIVLQGGPSMRAVFYLMLVAIVQDMAIRHFSDHVKMLRLWINTRARIRSNARSTPWMRSTPVLAARRTGTRHYV